MTTSSPTVMIIANDHRHQFDDGHKGKTDDIDSTTTDATTTSSAMLMATKDINAMTPTSAKSTSSIDTTYVKRMSELQGQRQ